MSVLDEDLRDTAVYYEVLVCLTKILMGFTGQRSKGTSVSSKLKIEWKKFDDEREELAVKKKNN